MEGYNAQPPRIDIRFYPRTRQQLVQESPSIAQGYSEEREAILRREQQNVLMTAGQLLSMPNNVACTAMAYMHKYYAKKSMQRNDLTTMAMACMLLAGKSEDCPRTLDRIIRNCWQARYGARGGRPADAHKLAQLDDPEWMRVKAEAVATAERALMYQLGFNLVVQMPYMVLNRMSAAWQPASMPIDLKQAIFQSAWFLVNDSWRTTLSLQYDHVAIAATALSIAFRLHKTEAALQSGIPWFLLATGVRSEMVYEIWPQLMQLYEDTIGDRKAMERAAQQAVRQTAKQALDEQPPGAVPEPWDGSSEASPPPTPADALAVG